MSEWKSWDELSQMEQAECIYSDMHKEAYGFRPRNDISEWTMEDFEAEFKVLAEVCESNNLQREEEERFAVGKLENRISALMQGGAKDRAMAIRWIAEAEDAGSDMEYLCFLVGVPYGYFKN